MPIGSYPYGSIDVAFSATPTFDLSTGDVFIMTLTGNITSMTMQNPQIGAKYLFVFKQDGSGLHSVAWPASFKGCIAIPITAMANTAAIQEVFYDGTNYWATALGQLNL